MSGTRHDVDPLLPRRDLDLLVPEFRVALAHLLDALHAEGILLAVFETARSPTRQAMLYARGRVPGLPDWGRTVTRAQPYGSAHQFGLAADLVFYVDGQWAWEEPQPGQWRRLRELAPRHGLATLSSEQPHVQLAGFAAHELPQGPPDEAGWLTWLRGRVGG